MKKSITGTRLAWLFAFLYCASYVTRINFAAIIQEVITETGFAKDSLSVILVALSVSYGVGQIINGRIGDKIRPQNLIFIGLCTATVANLLFPLSASSVWVMTLLWTVNGFAQAMMWPPMVKIMVSMMDEITYGSSVIIVSLGSSFGTVLVYLTAPLIIRFLSWEAVMYSAAALGGFSAVLWFFLKDRCYREDAARPEEPQAILGEKKRFRLPREAVFPFMFISLGIILMGMIRDGVTSWMPTYLSENFGFASDMSIFLTISLAIFSILSFLVAGVIYQKFFKNEVACATVIFGFAAVCALLLLLFFDSGGAILAVLMMALMTGAMHGVNLLLISHVPKRFRKYGNISTMSGLVNSFTYIGAAVATYGIAKISEVSGWKITVTIWLAVLIAGTAVCAVAAPKWKTFIKK